MSEWTKEKPKEPGYYWLRNGKFVEGSFFSESEKTSPVEVEDNGVYFIGCEVMFYNEDIIEAEWSGPIEPPSD